VHAWIPIHEKKANAGYTRQVCLPSPCSSETSERLKPPLSGATQQGNRFTWSQDAPKITHRIRKATVYESKVDENAKNFQHKKGLKLCIVSARFAIAIYVIVIQNAKSDSYHRDFTLL
jgi:hypothetical protein